MGPVDRVSARHRRLRLGELLFLFPGEWGQAAPGPLAPRLAGMGWPELWLWDPGPMGAVLAARAARGRLWEGTPVPSCLLRQGGRAPLAGSCVQGAPLAGRAAHVLSGAYYCLWPRTGCCSWLGGPRGGPGGSSGGATPARRAQRPSRILRTRWGRTTQAEASTRKHPRHMSRRGKKPCDCARCFTALGSARTSAPEPRGVHGPPSGRCALGHSGSSPGNHLDRFATAELKKKYSRRVDNVK